MLVGELEDRYGLKIEFDPVYGFIDLPEGMFKKSPEGGSNFIFFGHMGRMMDRLSEVTGKEPQEAFMDVINHALKKDGVKK